MSTRMALNRNDSPTPRKPGGQFNILEEEAFGDLTLASGSSDTSQSTMTKGTKRNIATSQTDTTVPLTTSKLANQQSPLAARLTSSKKIENQVPRPPYNDDYSPVDKLLSHLNQSTVLSGKHTNAITSSDSGPRCDSLVSIATEDMTKSGPTDSDPLINSESELFQLKLALEAAKDEIARKDRELAQQRITHHSIDQILSSPTEADFQLHNAPFTNRMLTGQEDASFSNNRGNALFSEKSPIMNQPAFPWADDTRSGAYPSTHNPLGQSLMASSGWNLTATPPWAGHEGRPGLSMSSRLTPLPQLSKPFNLRLDTFENNQHYMGNQMNGSLDNSFRRTSMPNTRPGSAAGLPFFNGFDPYSSTSSPGFSPPMTPMSFQQLHNLPQASGPYQPRPIGTPLSPTALEFSAVALNSNGPLHGNPWNTQVANVTTLLSKMFIDEKQTSSDGTSNYMPPMEPMNYRRLLDRNMSCNWKYIVDKIVCSNDQQASIFLQQKLKVAAPEHKYELVEAIIAQAYPLMINRFGNFLVQRCFEHGTPEQVVAIANAIRGNTLTLSMDAFGCHVVQKAFDVVPEEYKAMFVHELLRRIPETVIHRYACHVWQKLFELRWSDSPPQIMKYVNESLRGMWHEVALGETGSLVVQNIFENCLEEDKRPCINEVLASIDIVSHGQFGNWCIQHICEHGAPADKSRAIEHVLHWSSEYSTDQFASKVVEKCLKVCGSEFLDRYLERVCEGHPDRPRMPLIDIAGDQYGNYLVQYILINANPQHREVVANHVRKHMVSLRGSKFGSRVAMLCCNPASATRPGPPMGMQTNNRFVQNMGMGFPRSGPMGPYR